jgi:hypothetical protein
MMSSDCASNSPERRASAARQGACAALAGAAAAAAVARTARLRASVRSARQSSSLIPSWPAAWVTCPAIASAWSCASPPSVSASWAVNRLPPASCSRSRSAKLCRRCSEAPVWLACWRSTFAMLGWTLS